MKREDREKKGFSLSFSFVSVYVGLRNKALASHISCGLSPLC